MPLDAIAPAVGDPITATVGARLTNSGYQGDAIDGTNVVLANTTNGFAGSAILPFALAEQRRVRIVVVAAFVQAGTTNAQFTVQAGYNSGSSAVIGSVTTVGVAASVSSTVAGGTGTASGLAEGTDLLAAGSYTAYARVQRVSNGSATDYATRFYVAVYDVGSA